MMKEFTSETFRCGESQTGHEYLEGSFNDSEMEERDLRKLYSFEAMFFGALHRENLTRLNLSSICPNLLILKIAKKIPDKRTPLRNGMAVSCRFYCFNTTHPQR